MRVVMPSWLKTSLLRVKPTSGQAALPILCDAPRSCGDETTGIGYTLWLPKYERCTVIVVPGCEDGNTNAKSRIEPKSPHDGAPFRPRVCTQPSDSPISWYSHDDLSAPR